MPLAGVGVALLYGALVLLGLRTWWFDAVGTRLLWLHASIPPLAIGAAAGVVTGLASVAWTLRALRPVTPRALLAGDLAQTQARLRGRRFASLRGCRRPSPRRRISVRQPNRRLLLRRHLPARRRAALPVRLAPRARLAAVGGLVALGLRSVRYRPGRAVLCIALIASATFVIASLEAFRRDASPPGAFQLVADSELPIFQNIPPLEGVEFIPFRVRPGDDASCLNLYQPQNPRILAPPTRGTPGRCSILDSRAAPFRPSPTPIR